MKINNNNNKLKPGWKMVKFGEIADSLTIRVMPGEAETEYYVGLEHLDSDSLKIRRWGSPDDVEAQKLKFWPGDIIFGKRRCYQRKLAVAEFEGMCSAHAMVLRAKEDIVDKDFLPFFLQSDMFMQRALDISVGSLSPTINWKTLKVQEFPLPPKEEQSRISEILWACDKAFEDWRLVKKNLFFLQNAIINNTLLANSGEINSSWKIVPLKKVAKIQTGIAKGKSYKNAKIKELPYLRVANVQDGYLDLSEIKEICVAEYEIEKYSLKYGDVLMTEGGDFDKLGRGTIWREEIPTCLHQNHIFSVRTDATVLIPDFLSYQTGSLYGRRYFLKCSKKTSNLASINSTQVKDFPLLLPSISEQQKLLNLLRPIEEQKSCVLDYLADLENLKKTLICELIIH